MKKKKGKFKNQSKQAENKIFEVQKSLNFVSNSKAFLETKTYISCIST